MFGGSSFMGADASHRCYDYFLRPVLSTLGGGLQERFVLAGMARSSCFPLLGISGKPEPPLAIVWDWETCLILCQLIMTLSVL